MGPSECNTVDIFSYELGKSVVNCSHSHRHILLCRSVSRYGGTDRATWTQSSACSSSSTRSASCCCAFAPTCTSTCRTRTRPKGRVGAPISVLPSAEPSRCRGQHPLVISPPFVYRDWPLLTDWRCGYCGIPSNSFADCAVMSFDLSPSRVV